jgi:hypothetical protein
MKRFDIGIRSHLLRHAPLRTWSLRQCPAGFREVQSAFTITWPFSASARCVANSDTATATLLTAVHSLAHFVCNL